MNLEEAARILEVEATATPEQIETRFQHLRSTLEGKIAQAPTPGLQLKYRESLDAVISAFETLTLAADSSALPVLKKEAGDGRPEAGGPASLRAAGDGGAATPPRGPGAQTQDPRPSSARKSGGREFALIAVIAVAVLGAGGWFLMKTRAENAEKARIAAEARAEADRLAELARLEAEAEKARQEEARRLAEIERQRQEAAAAAERQRIADLTTKLRVDLSELDLRWGLAEREADDAERKLAELKSTLRGLRDPNPGTVNELDALITAQESYYQWVSDFLARHEARALTVRAKELVATGAVDEAQPLVSRLRTMLDAIDPEISRERDRRLLVTGGLELTSDPTGLNWEVTDAFGRTQRGTTPAQLSRLGRGTAQVVIRRAGWPDRPESVTIRVGETTSHHLELPGGTLKITANAPGAEVFLDGKSLGKTPLDLIGLPPGPVTYEVRAAGFIAGKVAGTVDPSAPLVLQAVLEEVPPSAEEQLAGFTQAAGGQWARTVDGYRKLTMILTVTPGSNRITVGSGVLGGLIKVSAGGELKVPDPMKREVFVVMDVNPKFPFPLEQRTAKIELRDGVLVQTAYTGEEGTWHR